MGECKPCHGGGKLYGAFGDSWECIPCRGTGQNRTGPYRLIDGTWSDKVDRRYRLKSSGFAMDNKRIHVYKGPWDFWTGCEWRAWSPLAGSKFFPTHAEAIAYADKHARMAPTNQGENNGR